MRVTYVSGPLAENRFFRYLPSRDARGSQNRMLQMSGQAEVFFPRAWKTHGPPPSPTPYEHGQGSPSGWARRVWGRPGMACPQGPAQPEGLRCGLPHGSDPMVGKGLALFSLAGGHLNPEAVSWCKKWGLGSQKQRAPAGPAIFRVRTGCGRRKGLCSWVLCLSCLKRSNG